MAMGVKDFGGDSSKAKNKAVSDPDRGVINFGDFPDVEVGGIYTTVRKSAKWDIGFTRGVFATLKATAPKNDPQPFGTVRVLTTRYGSFHTVTEGEIALNNSPSVTSRATLLAAMRGAYGPGFNDNDGVTVVTFRVLSLESEAGVEPDIEATGPAPEETDDPASAGDAERPEPVDETTGS